MPKQPIDDTVTMTGRVAGASPESIAATEMWLKDRTVPVEYLESLLGNARITVAVPAALLDVPVSAVTPIDVPPVLRLISKGK